MNAFLYAQGYRRMKLGEIDWVGDTIKIALLESTYSFDQHTHEFFSDVNAHEASGTGYDAGGKTLASRAVVYDQPNKEVRRNADDVVWENSTITARFAIIYKDTGNAATSPLVSFIDFLADRESANDDFNVFFTNGRVALTTLE